MLLGGPDNDTLNGGADTGDCDQGTGTGTITDCEP